MNLNLGMTRVSIKQIGTILESPALENLANHLYKQEVRVLEGATHPLVGCYARSPSWHQWRVESEW